MPIRFDGPLLRGRWRLGPRIGGGGQGHTYLARDESVTKGERLVVAKKVNLADGGWKRHELFEREARVLAQLDHPGIPKVLDRFEAEKGIYYLILAKAPGATLQLIARKVRFSDDELRDIMARTLDILTYLHERRPPVIHRDLKPANIIRAADGAITIVDFGGVRDAMRESGGSTVVGTFGYIAPEQLHGEATQATDLYGLGATIVALATGIEPEKLPRKGLRMDLAKACPGLAKDLRALLEQMTDPDPAGRPSSAREAKAMLRAARVPPPAKAPPPPVVHEPTSDDDLPRPLRIVMNAFLVAASTVGWVGLAVIETAMIPLLFAFLRIFTGKEKDQKLKAAEGSVRRALRDGRDGFREVQRRAWRLPPRHDPRRLPPRR